MENKENRESAKPALHITIKDNATGKILVDQDTAAIFGAYEEDGATTSVGFSRCGVEDGMATMLGALKSVDDLYVKLSPHAQRVFAEAVKAGDLAHYAKKNKKINFLKKGV